MRNQGLLNHFQLVPIYLIKTTNGIVLTQAISIISWEMIHNIIGAWLELTVFFIPSIFAFLVVMHDKFGVLALSE